MYYAHSLADRPEEDWQPLREHLEAVAARAEVFGTFFDAGSWARHGGLWHDLGKHSDAFQAYLRTSQETHQADAAPRTDHSTAGAQHAGATMGVVGQVLAFVISGHHSGLLDAVSDKACLDARLKKAIEPWGAAPADLLEPPDSKPPPILLQALAENDGFAAAFFTRMLFSCLVDADFLDTEGFLKPERAAARPVWPEDVLHRLEQALDAFATKFSRPTTEVDHQRAAVRRACLEKAALAPGLFSLTVPTGGGKTLSSLAFALRHAAEHGLRRVVYVLPFTTIIEQNAAEFRKVTAPLVGDGFADPVVEHHSNLDAGKETTASRLASENWDAPLVVTTSVQFYESLFACRTSRCRKLHNLARAVIILDEAQTLPVDYLEPCLAALRELTRSYGSTVVLCTATQPAVEHRDGFEIGLEGVREIVPDTTSLYRALRRAEVEDLGPLDDRTVADRVRDEDRVLCIVNTRRHARELYQALGESSGHFHLSALLCPEHRSAKLRVIRRRLNQGKTCRVISTQLIEAGVDVDFPCVYRALAGLDSIAQAAGRCNRHGLLPGKGRTYLFRSEHPGSEKFLADTMSCASQVLPLHDDPLSLEAIEHYFRLYYWDRTARWDHKDILDDFRLDPKSRDLPFLFSFAKAARNFRLIEDAGQPVIIPWGDGRQLCEELRSPWKLPDRLLLRKLQRYTVQIPRRVWDRHAGREIELVHDRYPVLTCPELHYHEHLGLALDEDRATFLNS